MIKVLKISNFWLLATFVACAIVVAIELATDAQKIVMIPYGIIIPILVLLPRISFYLNQKSIRNLSEKWINIMDFLVFLMVIFNAPLSLFLHQQEYQYDRFLHTIVPFISFLLATLFLIPSKIFEDKALIFYKNKYDKFLHLIFVFPLLVLAKMILTVFIFFGAFRHRKSKILFIAFFSLFTWLFIWEFIEYSIDIIFSTKIFGDFSQLGELDFWEDIYFGFLGILSAFFLTYYLYNWIIEKLSNILPDE